VRFQLLNTSALPLAFISELRVAAFQPGGSLPEILHILRKQSTAALLVVKLLLELPLCVFRFAGRVGCGISSNSGSGSLELICLTGFLGIMAPLRL
jgi:hypothetical protein